MIGCTSVKKRDCQSVGFLRYGLTEGVGYMARSRRRAQKSSGMGARTNRSRSAAQRRASPAARPHLLSTRRASPSPGLLLPCLFSFFSPLGRSRGTRCALGFTGILGLMARPVEIYALTDWDHSSRSGRPSSDVPPRVIACAVYVAVAIGCRRRYREPVPTSTSDSSPATTRHGYGRARAPLSCLAGRQAAYELIRAAAHSRCSARCPVSRPPLSDRPGGSDSPPATLGMYYLDGGCASSIPRSLSLSVVVFSSQPGVCSSHADVIGRVGGTSSMNTQTRAARPRRCMQ
ncbi:hypothetical protein GGR56DRAFT_309584 [Xylariaceae sp. FL0804]|nr:hypothetical protein GGR56DRAFT_309584 [Xylariaceae sp. FL0804]